MKHEKRIEGARQIMDQIRTNTVRDPRAKAGRS